MATYLLKRAMSAAFVILGVASLCFFLIHLVPGDPVDVMLGEQATLADRAELRAQLGLDQPLFRQFAGYLHSLVRLDLGDSLHTKQPIIDILEARAPATAQLAMVALLIAVALALPLGMLAAIRKDSAWDTTAMSFSMLGISVPHFVMGPVLILVFAVWLGWLPVSGRGSPGALVLPALTLGTGLAAILSRMVRSSLLEVLGEEYIRTARSKGLGRFTVLFKHAFRNALLPLVTVLGLQLGALLGGAVITEIVFSWPGIGELTIEAIQRRDYPVLQSCVLLISLTYVIVNTATDVLYAWLDPRIRLDQHD